MNTRRAWTCAVLASAVLAGAPAAAQVSHLGQNIGDHVMLRDGSASGRIGSGCPDTASFNDRALFRVLPDGTRAALPFTVPAGRQLVITDVEWTVDALATGLPLTSGGSVRTRLRIGSGASFTQVFLSRTVLVGAERGAVAGTEQLTTGIVVAAETSICPNAAEFGSGVIRSARIVEIVLRGYLIDAQ